MSGDRERCTAFNGGALEQEVERIAEQTFWRLFRRAIADQPGSRPQFASIAAYSRISGLGASTTRRYAKAAGIERQPNGKYLVSELDRAVACAGKPPTPSPAAPPAPADLAAARAQRVARELQTPRGKR